MKSPMRHIQQQRILFGLAILLVLVTIRAVAQEPEHRPVGPPIQSPRESEGRRFPSGRRPGRLAQPNPATGALLAEIRFDEEMVKGAPYAATAITESIQTLGDGTRITNKMTAKLWRDSEGRMRREQPLNVVGSFAVTAESQQLIIINDVVTRQRYVLDPEA